MTLKNFVRILIFVLFSLLLTASNRSYEKCPVESYSPSCGDGNPYNGYWWEKRWWVPGMVDNSTWLRQAPLYTKGRLVWYSPWMMEATAEYRGLSLDGYLDGVALMSPFDIGKTVYILHNNKWEGPFLVVDCARRADIYPIIRYRGEVIEVGAKTKTRWGLTKPLDSVEILVLPNAVLEWMPSMGRLLRSEEFTTPIDSIIAGKKPIDYQDWWMGQVKFTKYWQYPPLYIIGGGWKIR